MFELKKIIFSFLYPASIAFILSLSFFAYFLLKKEKKVSYFFLLISLTIYFFSTNFFWKILICRFEQYIEKNASLSGDVIAIFGGGVSVFYDKISETPGIDLYGAVRIFAGYRIHKKTNLPIILSGGRVFNQEPFSTVSKNLLLSLGLKDDIIHVDDLSRNTYENVLNIVKIAKENNYRSVIVVSDAIHIPRIMLVFKKIKYNASFYPSYYICSRFSWRDFVPIDMVYSKIFIHEFLGYVWYFLRY